MTPSLNHTAAVQPVSISDPLAGRPHWLDTYPSHLTRAWALRSGQAVIVRAVRHDDDAREEAFVRGLSPQSVYQRMFTRGFAITPEFISRLTHIDYRQHMAFAATRIENDVEQFTGVARYVVTAGTASAEFAIVIADAWQGRGLGRRLLQQLLEHAKAAGLHELHGLVLTTNRAMLSLALSLGFTTSRDPDDATVLVVTRRLAAGRSPVH